MSRLIAWLRILSFWLFWPGLALIIWGELTPQPTKFGPIFGRDKLENFTAYFGLASMATRVIGLKPKLPPTILDIILLGGLLELVQGLTGRDADIWDFVANNIGALSGWGVGVFVWWLTGLAGRRALD